MSNTTGKPTDEAPKGGESGEKNGEEQVEEQKQERETESAPPLSPPHPPHPKRSRKAGVLLFFALLVILAGGITGQYLLNSGSPLASLIARQVGLEDTFIQPSLSAVQIDDLRHLAQHMKAKQLATLYVDRMTLDEEIGQVQMVEYTSDTYSDDLDTMIHKLHAGGVIMYQNQINTLDQTRHDTGMMQQRATFPLLISADEEGWNVHRLTNVYPPRKSARDIHDAGSTNLATSEGRRVAHDLLSLGINTNLAPDVDVSPDEAYIGWDYRSFGTNPKDVIKYTSAYIKAMQEAGVIATIKHFPGLGAVQRGFDPHSTLPTVNESKTQIMDVDLAPFKYYAQTQDKLEKPGMIMSTDVLMPALDPKLPAEISPNFITPILRQQFGYDGVVISDALTMGGVSIDDEHIDLPKASVMALNAGNDLLLGISDTNSMQAVVTAIKQAINDGTLSRARLDEAATRVLALKIERGLVPAVPPQD